MNATLTAIPGFFVGHCTDHASVTGCTAVLCPAGFTPGVCVPGFAPGSRETELMRAHSPVEAMHGIALAGGSAFGLAAADGVMRFLFEKGYGRETVHATVPLVAGAIIYDLDVNTRPGILPDAAMGYSAAKKAYDNGAKPVEQGRVGVGTGASCGRLFRGLHAKSIERTGLASALVEYKGLQVGALVVANALGNVHDPATGAWLAGGRDKNGQPYDREAMLAVLSGTVPEENTVLVVVATNVPLDKTQTNRLAHMAGAGLAQSIRPTHLIRDGDVVFAMATRRPLPEGASGWSENLLGAMAAEAVVRAIVATVQGE